jgi:hypothetical protein
MFTLFRWLFVLLLLVGGIGFFRGWFSFSSPTRDTESNKVKISVSVDAKKVEADVEELKEEITDELAQRTEKPDEKATAK